VPLRSGGTVDNESQEMEQSRTAEACMNMKNGEFVNKAPLLARKFPARDDSLTELQHVWIIGTKISLTKISF
jgi:hypothetical protein